MSQQVYASEADAVGKPYIDQRVTKLEAAVIPGPGAAGKMAYYDGAGNLNDANIAVVGASNDLLFNPGTTIGVDNIQPVSPTFTLGAGFTDTIAISSTNAITIDATNSITLGHVGFTVNIVDKLDVMNIDTSIIDSSGSLIIGPTAVNVVIGVAGADVTVVDSAPFIVQDINHPTALTIGDTTPSTAIDAVTSLTLGHIGMVTTIDDSVQVDTINTNDINSSTGTLTIGDTTATVNLGVTPGAGTITVPFNCILTCSQIDAVGATYLYNSSASLLIGAPIGTTAFNDKIVFNKGFATTLDFYASALNLNVTGTGPTASQVIGNLSLQRLGDVVTVIFRWTIGVIVTVPATAIMTLDTAIDAIYRPTNTQSCICRVYVSSVTAQGKFSIASTGVVTFFPAVAPGTWTVGQGASADQMSIIYNVNM